MAQLVPALGRLGRRRIDRHEDGLAGSHQPLGIATPCEQLGRGEHLATPGLDDAGPRDKRIAHRRRQAIDGEVRGEHVARDREGGEAAGGVDQGADESGMEESGVLAEVVAPGQAQLDLPGVAQNGSKPAQRLNAALPLRAASAC